MTSESFDLAERNSLQKFNKAFESQKALLLKFDLYWRKAEFRWILDLPAEKRCFCKNLLHL